MTPKSAGKKTCPACGGSGIVQWEEPNYETVTRDMATDAGDRQLEGQQIQFGTIQCQDQCPECKGTGELS